MKQIRVCGVLLITLVAVAACAPDQPYTGETVVLVHGLGRSPASMAVLRNRLEHSGYTVINWGYPSRSEPIEVLIAQLSEALVICCSESTEPVHFVTHSMGGVLVRGFLAGEDAMGSAGGSGPVLGRVVMLSPPSQGSEIIDAFADSRLLRMTLGPAAERLGTDSSSIAEELGPVEYPVGVITGSRSFNPIGSWLIPGPDDGKVGVENARIDGASAFLVIPATHTFIMNRRDVADEIVHFIRNGTFGIS